MAAEGVEILVTLPVLTAVKYVTGARCLRSSSTTEFSIRWMEFDCYKDISIARQIVNEKLLMVQSSILKEIDCPVLAPISCFKGGIILTSFSFGFASFNNEMLNEMELCSVADWRKVQIKLNPDFAGKPIAYDMSVIEVL